MKKIFIIPLVILFIISCKEKKVFLNTTIIKNCINNKFTEKADTHMDVYGELKKIEDLLIKSNLLDNINKQSYVDLFDKLNGSISKDIKTRINKFHLGVSSSIKNRNNLIFTSTIIDIFNCNKTYINSLKIDKNSKYLSYKTVLNKLMNKGDFDNFVTIKKLIKSIPKNDFSDINYRVPLISLYSLMSDYYYNNDR